MNQILPKSVYVASSWDNKPTVRLLSAVLIQAGVNVTQRWTEAEDGSDLKEQGLNDIEDIQRADSVILVLGKPSTSGGMHFEAGYAYSAGKLLITIGERGHNPFYRLPGVMHFEAMDHFILEVMP